MTCGDSSDRILRGVSQLPILTPNEDRAERLRAGCRARLARRAPEPRRAYGSALLAGICLLYLSAIVHHVLRLRGLL